ncbi:MAG: hypothetical protein K4304_08670 [Propionicimonas sp.]
MGKQPRLDAHDKSELRQFLGFRPHALAIARCPHGAVVGLADRLVYRTAQGWAQLPWHTVEHGRWDSERNALEWTTTAGAEGSLDLAEAAPLLQLFHERVGATIVCTQTVPLGKKRSAVVSARQDLTDPTAPLIWQVSAGADTSAQGLSDEPAVNAALAQLRDEYDLG